MRNLLKRIENIGEKCFDFASERDIADADVKEKVTWLQNTIEQVLKEKWQRERPARSSWNAIDRKEGKGDVRGLQPYPNTIRKASRKRNYL